MNVKCIFDSQPDEKKNNHNRFSVDGSDRTGDDGDKQKVLH